MNFINFYGDFVNYRKISLQDFEKNGGSFIINNKKYFKYDFEFAILFPHNKGYVEEKLMKFLYPNKQFEFHVETNTWLIKKFVV